MPPVLDAAAAYESLAARYGSRQCGEEEAQQRAEAGTGPTQVRLPGFLIEEQIGLGDVIKQTTYAMGIKPCRGCESAQSLPIALYPTVGMKFPARDEE